MMEEGKAIYAVMLFIGVPAFIYTWFDKGFLNISTTLDLTKTIILATIAIGLGLFALIRSLIKTIYDILEFRDKMKERRVKKK